ncbi:hypothetical protein B0T18DRAFT_104836 [Schizothecium vesticola]|uniref:Uncharacterized protein n=1 Tax=Schizothecium vesticola TaxID=314040 RepID=A0AA40K806_9PEZI|nr:hypothetical protein B0T18DRAFT_104836 [Schizothecium vesticola]
MDLDGCWRFEERASPPRAHCRCQAGRCFIPPSRSDDDGHFRGCSWAGCGGGGHVRVGRDLGLPDGLGLDLKNDTSRLPHSLVDNRAFRAVMLPIGRGDLVSSEKRGDGLMSLIRLVEFRREICFLSEIDHYVVDIRERRGDRVAMPSLPPPCTPGRQHDALFGIHALCDQETGSTSVSPRHANKQCIAD